MNQETPTPTIKMEKNVVNKDDDDDDECTEWIDVPILAQNYENNSDGKNAAQKEENATTYQDPIYKKVRTHSPTDRSSYTTKQIDALLNRNQKRLFRNAIIRKGKH